MLYQVGYSPQGVPVTIRQGENVFIPISDSIAFREFLAWNEQQSEPLDWQSPIAPSSEQEAAIVIFEKPVSAPDFIVSSPPIKDDPEEALLDAIAEMEKGAGNPKSIALIALSLAKYLKSKREKLK